MQTAISLQGKELLAHLATVEHPIALISVNNGMIVHSRPWYRINLCGLVLAPALHLTSCRRSSSVVASRFPNRPQWTGRRFMPNYRLNRFRRGQAAIFITLSLVAMMGALGL